MQTSGDSFTSSSSATVVYMSAFLIPITSSLEKATLPLAYQAGGIAFAEEMTQSRRTRMQSTTTSGASSQRTYFALANERKSPYVATKVWALPNPDSDEI
ncbi:hypothetical protein G7Z17_g11476 [Cylindrodendrum hubeiense]|uniref:Uncharacterized protein n=1 Tax=Cylindrodendrum hubeiense TaxID=595255 RepID=A0A9P5H0Y2_9HYPO|nr:hypothetical protein G7Z17_g11476 [Cylindrodendrum hubeiense]